MPMRHRDMHRKACRIFNVPFLPISSIGSHAPMPCPSKLLGPRLKSIGTPDVVELADNDYRMFFNAEVSGSGQGIGVARASHPEGSFTVVGDPLVSGEHYRHIDAKVFHNPLDQRWYLLWGSYYEPIVIKELRPDLLGFLAPASAPIESLGAQSPQRYNSALRSRLDDDAL